MPPIPNVIALGRVCPGLAVPCTSCFNVVYVVNLTAEFAPCRIIYSHVRLPATLLIKHLHTTGKSPLYIPEIPSCRMIAAVPCIKPRYWGFRRFASSISFVLYTSNFRSLFSIQVHGTNLIVSEGVTAKIASVIPAPSPA